MENAHIDYQLKGKSAFTQPTQGVTTINEKTWKIPNTELNFKKAYALGYATCQLRVYLILY